MYHASTGTAPAASAQRPSTPQQQKVAKVGNVTVEILGTGGQIRSSVHLKTGQVRIQIDSVTVILTPPPPMY